MKKRSERLHAEAASTKPRVEIKPLDPKFVPVLEAFADANEGIVDPGLIVMMIPKDIPNRPTTAQVATEAEARGFQTARLDHNVAFLAPPEIRASLFNVAAELESQFTALREQVAALQTKLAGLLEEETATVSNFEEYSARNAKLKLEIQGLEAVVAERLKAVEAEIALRNEQSRLLVEHRTQEAAKTLADAKEAAAQSAAQAETQLEQARTEAERLRSTARLDVERLTAEGRSERERLIEAGAAEGKELVSSATEIATLRTAAAADEVKRIIDAANSEAAAIIGAAKQSALTEAAALLGAEKQRFERELAKLESALSTRKTEVEKAAETLQQLQQQIASAQQRSAELAALIESHRRTAAELEKTNQAKTREIEQKLARLQQAQSAFDKRVSAAPKIVEEARNLRRTHKDRLNKMRADIEESMNEAKIHMPRVKLMLAAAVVILIISVLLHWLK